MAEQAYEGFDVVVYEYATGRISAIIGENMRRWDGEGSGRNTAEYRAQTGAGRCNDAYGTAIVPTGKYKEGDVMNATEPAKAT